MWYRCAVPLCFMVSTVPGVLHGQDTLPPHRGGYIRSLGLPPVHHPYTALAVSLDRQAESHMGVQLRVGLADMLGNPVAGVLSVAGEAYGGRRDGAATAGVRGLAHSPLLGAGAGLDLEPADGRLEPFLMFVSHLRRGGIAGRGSHVRFEWYPGRSHSLAAALTVPLNTPHAGRTRPARDHVVLRVPREQHRSYVPTPDLQTALASLDESAFWVNRTAVAPLGRTSADAALSVRTAVAPLQGRLAQRTAAAEIAAYHTAMERAFSIAAGGCALECGMTDDGKRIAAHARQVLLHGVIFPYNRLLGQQKKTDTTGEFGQYARGSFARWLVREDVVTGEDLEATLHVFQRLLDIIESVRAHNRAEWRDSRLVWLPLQLALQPHEYVLKEDLDTIISHAVGRRVQHGNRMWYLYNSRFHQQLAHSIADARDYHVLWIHDFRGVAEGGRPDSLALMLVAREYLHALRDRVLMYDSVGRLPAYMIFLDQHYFELNESRELLALLQDPLHRRLRLRGLSDALADSVAQWQHEIRAAVDASRLLSVERREYGERWLQRLVKVHVSVTNPADPSFRSPQGRRPLSIPDDIMRDHRKAVVYDVSEDDPFSGMAMYAGMGVGEHYATQAWEDRALMLQGPAALSLRDAARRLLESQGFKSAEVPHVLRPRALTPDYDERVRIEIDSMDLKGEVAVRALELHNSTGFGPKEIAVAQATLLNLASPGSVFKIPDSLWMNELFAALAAGAALRGSRVLPVAPSSTSAPAPALGMIGIHDVFSRMLAFSRAMQPDIARAGGALHPGIYHASVGVDDVGARTLAFAGSLRKHAVLRELYPTLSDFFESMLQGGGPADEPPAARLPVQTSSAGESYDAPHAAARTPASAKLHMKGFLYISQPAWSRLIEGPPLTQMMQLYLAERQRLVTGESHEEALVAVLRRAGAEIINPIVADLPGGERSEWVFYLQVGSPNMDYRSMLLDGEVAALISDWTSLYAFFDFMLLMGLVEWVVDQDELDRLVPPPGPLRRRMGRWIRFAI